MLLTILASLGGFGAIAGIALRIFGWAGTLNKLSSAGSTAVRIGSKIPAKVWYVVIALVVAGLVVFFGLRFHANKVEAFGTERYRAGYTQATTDIREQERLKRERMQGAKANNQRAETKSNATIGTTYDATSSSLSARAQRLLQRPKGPGGDDAAGGSLPGAVGAPGELEATAAGLLDARLAGITWEDLVYWSERSTRAEAQVNALLDHKEQELQAFEQWKTDAGAAAK